MELYILIIVSIIIAAVPYMVLKSELKIRGIPIRRDYSRPTPREAFDVFAKDTRASQKEVYIVTGEVDCTVYDKKAIQSLSRKSIFEEIEESLKQGIKVSIFASSVITIADKIKDWVEDEHPHIRRVRDKIANDGDLEASEMIMASDVLGLVLNGVVDKSGNKNFLKLYALEKPSHRHYRIVDPLEPNAALYVEYHHPPLEAVHQFYTVEKSVLKIKKYMRKLDKLKMLEECNTPIKINNNFEFIYRQKYYDQVCRAHKRNK